MRRNRAVSLEGFDELDRAMKRVGDRASGLLLLRAAEKGADVIVEEAQRLAPKKSGDLAKGIHAKVRRAQVGRVQMDISYDKKQWYGALIEKGTKKMAAHPFLRPALEKVEDVKKKVGEVLRHALRDVL